MNVNPWMVMWRDAIVKISPKQFDRDSTEASVFVTNTSVKGDETPMEEVKMTPGELEQYLIETGEAQPGWLDSIIRPQMRDHVVHLTRQLM